MKNCKDCVHFDANIGGVLPLCLNFPQQQIGECWFFSCIASRVLDDLCGQDGIYFEAKMSELEQAQFDAVLDHFLN